MSSRGNAQSRGRPNSGRPNSSGRTDKTKSVKRQKQEGTQEFFSKKKADGFTFSQAPMNKKVAIEKIHEGEDKKHKESRKRSAFVSKLYEDEAEVEDFEPPAAVPLPNHRPTVVFTT